MPLFLLKIIPFLMRFGPIAKYGPKILPALKNNGKFLTAIVLILVMALMLHFKNNIIESLTLDKAEYTRWQTEFTLINEDYISLIASLEVANESLAQAVVVSEEVRAEASAASRERERRAKISLDEALNKLRGLENETPACAEINRIDIGAACPASVDILRRAASKARNQN